VPAGQWNYNANDRFTAGDTYDADGNTVSSGGIANVYDFENHLIQKAGVTIVYDGNRVSKTVAGVTTTYLVDTLNPIRTASRNLQRSPFEEPRHHDYCDRQQRE
jgi:flagellar capping protein FliD